MQKGPLMSRKLVILLTLLVFAAGSCDRRSASQMYTDAETQISKDKFEDAAKTFQKLEKKYPDNELAAKSAYRLAELYMNNIQDLSKAIQVYRHVADVYPQSAYGPKSRFMAGFLLANNTSRFDEAKTEYKRFLADYADNELASAVKFELDNLGKDIDDIPQLKGMVDTAPDSTGK